MDIGIEVNGFVILAIIGVLGAAGIAGGIVLYRRGARPSVRAFGAASVAAGTVMWAVVLVSTPMSSSTSGDGSPEGVPTFSGMCAEEVPDCNDTIVVPDDGGETGDEFDGDALPPDDRIDDGTSGDVPSIDPQIEVESEPGVAVGEPPPTPGTSGPKGPAACDTDGYVTITSDGKYQCEDPPETEPLQSVETLADGDSPQPIDTPTLEPGDVDEYGKEVPIGTFDQDGGSEPSTGSGVAEGAPVAGGVTASSDLQ